jgi:signal transduction histidine kinase
LQVLLKLLGNAVTFSKPGGKVSVGAWQTEDGLFMRITDEGIGMAADDIPRALEAFSQVDNRLARKYQGAGLGLPLARQFMELHGGTLAIDSTPGKGTTVTVTLPRNRLLAARRIA